MIPANLLQMIPENSYKEICFVEGASGGVHSEKSEPLNRLVNKTIIIKKIKLEYFAHEDQIHVNRVLVSDIGDPAGSVLSYDISMKLSAIPSDSIAFELATARILFKINGSDVVFNPGGYNNPMVDIDNVYILINTPIQTVNFSALVSLKTSPFNYIKETCMFRFTLGYYEL